MMAVARLGEDERAALPETSMLGSIPVSPGEIAEAG
jgi:hypothetical protein